MQTNTQMLHLRIAAEALRMHHALRQAKAAAIADGGRRHRRVRQR